MKRAHVLTHLPTATDPASLKVDDRWSTVIELLSNVYHTLIPVLRKQMKAGGKPKIEYTNK